MTSFPSWMTPSFTANESAALAGTWDWSAGVCTCDSPVCAADHAAYVAAPITEAEIAAEQDSDEFWASQWEGPMQPEYSEYDAEAQDEMAADDLRCYPSERQQMGITY